MDVFSDTCVDSKVSQFKPFTSFGNNTGAVHEAHTATAESSHEQAAPSTKILTTVQPSRGWLEMFIRVVYSTVIYSFTSYRALASVRKVRSSNRQAWKHTEVIVRSAKILHRLQRLERSTGNTEFQQRNTFGSYLALCK